MRRTNVQALHFTDLRLQRPKGDTSRELFILEREQEAKILLK